MRKLIMLPAAVLCLILVAGSTGIAGGRMQESRFSVISVARADRTDSFDVISDDLVWDLQKDLDMEYRLAVKAWEGGMREAKKNKQEYRVPRPSKPALRVLARGLDRDKAHEFKQKAESAHMKKINAKKKNAEGDRGRTARYSVLMVAHMDGTVSFRAVEDRSVAKLKEELASGFKQALEKWELRKREASGHGETFIEPKPARPAVKVLKRGLAEIAAEEARQKAEDAHAGREKKKDGARLR